MLQVMLCGAHDVGELGDGFKLVARDFGAEPWFYQDGQILHQNSATSTWTRNSRATVSRADICVFVILERYGDITWGVELQEALDIGKPFIVLALESAWTRYNTLLHSLADTSNIVSSDDERMVELLRMISSDYQITIVPFTYSTFRDKLRVQLSMVFQAGCELIESRNQRATLLEAMGPSGPLPSRILERVRSLAEDEYESNKLARKAALRRLAENGFRDEQFVLDVCRSKEQGVQRLAFDLLSELLPLPASEGALLELAEISGQVDDIGISRRFITSLVSFAPTRLDTVLDYVTSSDEGIRRRAFEGAELHLDMLRDEWGDDRLRRFLHRCESPTAAGEWRDRLRTLLESL